jgi:hypothetical protein
MHPITALPVTILIAVLGACTPGGNPRVPESRATCTSPKLQPAAGEAVPNSFIVVLDQTQRPPAEVSELARTLAAKYQVSLSSVYDQLGMFAIEADEQRACRLSLDSRVASVSRDHIATID